MNSEIPCSIDEHNEADDRVPSWGGALWRGAPGIWGIFFVVVTGLLAVVNNIDPDLCRSDNPIKLAAIFATVLVGVVIVGCCFEHRKPAVTGRR